MTASAGLLGAAAYAAETVDELVVGAVRDVHTSIAGRVHRALDAAAGGTTLEHRLHDGIAVGVYGGIGWGLRGAARALRSADRSDRVPRVEGTAAGRSVLAAVNGLVGDRLREERPELFFEAAVRHQGRDVELAGAGIAAAFPDATATVAVLVHGLCESEEHWRRRSRPVRGDGDGAPPYAVLLRELGWTPVDLRLNTGVPLAENGVATAALLARLVEQWPVPVRRIALIGHSMGGLILRAACAVAGQEHWTDLVTDVVTLGTPHLGAPLERVVAAGTPWLGRLPEVAPVGRILEYRSRGILDLRQGLAADVQNLPHARYHLVAGSLTRSPHHLVARTLGDLLVPPRSALGLPRGAAPMFPDADLLHIPGAGHFDLLNHDDVHTALRAWLADRPDATPARPRAQETARP
ncbi:MAG: esterase/lipase family protein [Marmoricola sp.]